MAYGEFIGIARFSKGFNQFFFPNIDKIVEEGRTNEFFEVALNQTLEKCVYGVDVSDLPCIEIDTLDDLDKARGIFYKIADTDNKYK